MKKWLLFLVATVCGLIATSASAQRLHRGVGYIDPVALTFQWVGGGMDSLQLPPEQALALPPVREVLPESVARVLLERMTEARRGAPNHVVQEGDREQFMLSGANGWIANNVVAKPSRWRPTASRRAWVVWYTEPSGVQWRMTFFEVCSNIAVSRFRAPVVRCVCEPERGDACP